MAQKFRERILQGSGFSNIAFESDYGMGLLKKMGWSEGKGLGKEEKGMVDPLQMRRREDNLGLGFQEADKFKWNNNWWENNYNNAVSTFNLEYEASSEEDEEDTGPNVKRLSRRKARLNYNDDEKKHHVPVVVKKGKKAVSDSEESEEEEDDEKVLKASKKIQKTVIVVKKTKKVVVPESSDDSSTDEEVEVRPKSTKKTQKK